MEAAKWTLPEPAHAARHVKRSVYIILGIVLFYWSTSIVVVFFNKLLLSGSEFKFPYPFAVTWFQLLLALVMLWVFGRMGSRDGLGGMIPPLEFNTQLAKNLLPLSVIYVLMLSTNNLSLLYVEVTFYQVLRSQSILFNIVLTGIMLKQVTSPRAILGCLLVVVGFVVGSIGEANFSLLGVVYGLLSSFLVALYGIYVKKALMLVDNNQWRLMHYNVATSALLLPIFVLLSGEWSDLVQHTWFANQAGFWAIMIVTGVASFLIHIAMFIQIKYTSPLTNTVSGNAKACVQTVLAAVVFGNTITVTNAIGILITLFGAAFYSLVRYKEMTASVE